MNLPIGAVALVAGWRPLRERAARERQRFDLPRAALLALALATLTLGLSLGQDWGCSTVNRTPSRRPRDRMNPSCAT